MKRRTDDHRGTENRNARINKKANGNCLQTYTARRDSDSLSAEMTSTPRRSLLLVTKDGTMLAFNGREARTIFRLLSSHYANS